MRWLQVEELERQAALAGDLPRRAQQQQWASGSLAQPEKLFYIDAQVQHSSRLHSQFPLYVADSCIDIQPLLS